MRPFLFIAAAAALFTVPAIAEDSFEAYQPGNGVEADTSYEASMMRLGANGYRDVRMVKDNPLRLSAYDREGSEVILAISPQTGEIDRSDYVYSMDK